MSVTPFSPGVLTRLAMPRGRAWMRHLVLGRLQAMTSGRVTIKECDQSSTVGAGALHATLQVRDPRFYTRVLLGGQLGAAESFLLGEWDSDELTDVFRIFARSSADADRFERGVAVLRSVADRVQHWVRRNTRQGSRRNIRDHYDLGNEFFALFLDETLSYSCAVFEQREHTLAQAAVAKLDLVCRKLELKPTDHLLEIGTGWGGLALHAAQRFGCRVTTTTISSAQHELAAQRIAAAGLQDRVTLLNCDYRDLDGHFDKLVSIEMIEAVGHERLPAFFRRCGDLLLPTGAMLLQAITMPDQRYRQYLRSVDFIRKYVFPGSCVPSINAMLGAAARVSDLRLVQLQDIGLHYARTLREWHARFVSALPQVRALGYPERLTRLWRYYLSYCEAGFAERYVSDVQLLFAKPRCHLAALAAAGG